MTTKAKTVSTEKPAAGLVSRVLHRLSMGAKILLAVALALTPVTAVLVLGWLVRLMRRESLIFYVRRSNNCRRHTALSHLGQIEQLQLHQRFPGWWSGLWQTVRCGLQALVVVTLVTLPFGLLLLLSWWAGWENSFNKGYEQAWAGPTIALVGFALAITVLSHFPMAFAHFAAEGRIGAVTEIRRIRRLIRLVRWRYLALTLATVLAAGPLFLAQILPTFMEKIDPRVLTAGPEEIRAIANQWHLATTVYLVAVLFLLRRWAARLYARAILSEPELAGVMTRNDLAAMQPSLVTGQPIRRHWLGMVFATVLGLTAWGGFLVLLYIAQLANHAWWNWINHAHIGIPWIFRPL